MKLDNNGYKLIQKFEGLKLSAYQDSVGIWTIGYGNITYEDGAKVKKGDKVSQERADQLFRWFADRFASQVDTAILVPVSQNQFNAVTSFAYNVGIGALRSSTLLKKLNRCATDPTIKDEFAKWNKAGGRVIQGLVNRRAEEAKIYFTKN